MDEFIPTARNIPKFRINLSLAPCDRYIELARIYRDRMRSLHGIFDELILALSPKIPVRLVHWLARLCMRRLYSDEETDELRGIAAVTGIELYLLICFNTVLDLLMGCTSGGVRIETETHQKQASKMLHFRTLDWSMDPLRDLIVQLDFFRDESPNTTLATSVTYVGCVGVLTGVRAGLSASLNFRPVHDSAQNQWVFYTNHLLVLLGMRQSISSLLREYILPNSSSSFVSEQKTPGWSILDDIVLDVPGLPTTAAYLIFSDGDRTVTMEKDYGKARVCSSSSFIIATNHDQEQEQFDVPTHGQGDNHIGLSLISSEAQSLADLIEESIERRACMQTKWDRAARRHAKALEKHDTKQPTASKSTRSSLRLRQKQEMAKEKILASEMAITQAEAIAWLTTYPVLNESTHYAVIMDPARGKVVWGKQYDSQVDS